MSRREPSAGAALRLLSVCERAEEAAAMMPVRARRLRKKCNKEKRHEP